MVGVAALSCFNYSAAGSAFRVERNVPTIAGGAPRSPVYVGAKRAITEGLPRFARAPQEEGPADRVGFPTGVASILAGVGVGRGHVEGKGRINAAVKPVTEALAKIVA